MSKVENDSDRHKHMKWVLDHVKCYHAHVEMAEIQGPTLDEFECVFNELPAESKDFLAVRIEGTEGFIVIQLNATDVRIEDTWFEFTNGDRKFIFDIKKVVYMLMG